MSIHLILGGARSGKSALAEQLAVRSALEVTYVATAQVVDAEFEARIAEHQSRRPRDWQLVEAPFRLAETIRQIAAPNRFVIVDCLTLWLAQCICPDCDHPTDALTEAQRWSKERSELLAILPHLPGELCLVSNEVGMGIVPLGAINRQFQDEQGRLNQAVAQLAQRVTFVAAGCPLTLKDNA